MGSRRATRLTRNCSEWTEAQAVPWLPPRCRTRMANERLLDLPGRLEAYTQAQIYARVSGYLKDWKADIGTPVKAGQLLAEIDAPDLDQQIMQAGRHSPALRPTSPWRRRRCSAASH